MAIKIARVLTGVVVAAAAYASHSKTAKAAATTTTPSSSCQPSDVLWLWKGALTSQSVTFKFGLRDGHTCRDQDFVMHAFPVIDHAHEKPHSTIAMCAGVGNGNHVPVMACTFEELPYPDRTYHYTLRLDKHVVRKGTFQTPPLEGDPFNFRFVFSSCADEDSNPQVFREMQATNPFFFLHMGDLHYHNIDTNDVARFRNAYHSLFASPSGRAMLEMDLPFAYMWDDHDYGPDNSDKTAPGRNASVQVYREFVPHYALPGDRTAMGPLSAVYQAFTLGRVRFLLTDLRSMRTPNLSPDVPSKTVLGAKQKQWFKEELARATNDPSIGLIVWCSTMPWHDDERKWGYFTHEQRELVHYMQGHGINRWKPVVFVSGDAHMLAVDDGSHTPGNLMLFHAAALGRPGSIKGGPYSHGAFPGSGQYGIMDVQDDGKRVCLYFQGVRMGTGVLVEYDTCHPERTPSNGTYAPPPIPIRQLTRAWRKVTKSVSLSKAIVMVVTSVVVLLPVWKRLRAQNSATSKKNR